MHSLYLSTQGDVKLSPIFFLLSAVFVCLHALLENSMSCTAHVVNSFPAQSKAFSLMAITP